MADIYDAGHRETETDLPGPLQSGWYPGTWALPATTLSAASLLVLVVVFSFLQIGEMSRALFRLPWPSGWPALAAAMIAWGIAMGCRNRPGRHLPRWWVLFLAALATVLAGICFLPGDLGKSPWAHALALAALAASLTLSPRLIPLQPSSWLVQHVAPLVLAAVLFMALPASLAFGHQAVEDQKRHVADTIVELSRQAAQVREISSFEELDSPERRQEVLRQIERLQDLPLEQWLPDRYLWKGAAVLGEEERLAAACRDLLDALVEGIDPARTPKLWQPQFIWNRDQRQWEQDPVFPEMSAAVAGYHWRRGQLLYLLAPPAGESGVLRDLASYYTEKEREAGERLAALSKTWAEDWVPPLMEAHDLKSGPALTPLADLLQLPILADGSLRPASLEKLLDLRLGRARRIASPTYNCGEVPYPKDDFEYFRIDCYAYAARLDPKNPGADLRVEMRIVYKSEKLEPLDWKDQPAEVYFLFPVPQGSQPAVYREDVMKAIEAAARKEHPEAEIKKIDPNIPGKGFFFESRDHSIIRVASSQFDDLGGGVPGIQVRALYRDRAL